MGKTVEMLSEKASLEGYRARLLAERDRLKQLLGAVTGSLQMSVEQDESSAKMRSRLNEVTSALGRIEAGTFGRCRICQAEIPSSVLESKVTASHCCRCEMMARLSG